jgi:lysozyme
MSIQNYRTSEKGLAVMKHYEKGPIGNQGPGGFAKKMYYCPANEPTIGWGHVIRSHEQELMTAEIDEAKAVALLAADLLEYEAAVKKFVKVAISQEQFDALVLFTYNCGVGALQNSTLLKKLNAADYAGAAAQFLIWDKAKVNKKVNGVMTKVTVALAGLTARRKSENLLFVSGEVKFFN